MIELHPATEPFNKGFLRVSLIHEIYFEESGNPHGIPVLHIHGGPGARSKPRYRQLYNPEKYRIILFDQRGCGRSKPAGEIKDNTIRDLVEDIEKLREYLEIDKWTLHAPSWGSTLGLAYAEKYPECVKTIVLRGVWLCRKVDIDWLYGGEALRRIFPDLWDQRIATAKDLKIDPENFISGAYEKLISGTHEDQCKVCEILGNWENQFDEMNKEIKYLKADDIDENLILSNRILLHYMKNYAFLEENEILEKCDVLKDIPIYIVHGRYDMVCPVDQAYLLHKALPKSKIKIVSGNGHHGTEPGILEEIVKIFNDL